MGILITLAAKAVGPRLAPFLVYGLAIAAVLAALWWLRHDAYGDGVRAERSAWEARQAKAAAEQARREREADLNLQQQRARDAAAARQRQQEIDDATRHLPDQAPSARQRARACLELRRQGQPQPAC